MQELKQILSLKQLEEGRLPTNYVLLEMTHSSEGIKSKGGVIVGVSVDDEYEDETVSHRADLAEVYARVFKVPDKLYFDTKDQRSMSWDCDMDLMINDLVWFCALESKNAIEIECEGRTFRLIPYSDIYVAKRKQSVIMLNGYLLCKPVFTQTEHALAIDDKKENKTMGIIAYVGKPNRRYQREEYIDFPDLRVGDEVLYNPGSPLFPLERKSYLAQFDGDNLYNVVQRRRVAMILKRN
jgi:hypothetical protein